MKAAVVGENGVEVREAPKPSPKPNEILIKVKAASLNRADLAVASGHAHGRVGGPGTIVGLECAGEVEAVGADVKGVKPGARVMSSAAGGFAEYAVADSGRAHRIPANNMTYEQASCMPVAVQTMHNALVGAGRLKKAESVLIQGASSGVGLLGMQIAKIMGASVVLGSSTNDGRRARLGEFGCDVAIDTRDPQVVHFNARQKPWRDGLRTIPAAFKDPFRDWGRTVGWTLPEDNDVLSAIRPKREAARAQALSETYAALPAWVEAHSAYLTRTDFIDLAPAVPTVRRAARRDAR